VVGMILVLAYIVCGLSLDLLAPQLLASTVRTGVGEQVVLTHLGQVFYPVILVTEESRSLARRLTGPNDMGQPGS